MEGGREHGPFFFWDAPKQSGWGSRLSEMNGWCNGRLLLLPHCYHLKISLWKLRISGVGWDPFLISNVAWVFLCWLSHLGVLEQGASKIHNFRLSSEYHSFFEACFDVGWFRYISREERKCLKPLFSGNIRLYLKMDLRVGKYIGLICWRQEVRLSSSIILHSYLL